MSQNTKRTVLIIAALLALLLFVLCFTGCERTEESGGHTNTAETPTETPDKRSAPDSEAQEKKAGKKNVYLTVPKLDCDIADALNYSDNGKWKYDPENEEYRLEGQSVEGSDYTYSVQYSTKPLTAFNIERLLEITFYDRFHTQVSRSLIKVFVNARCAADEYYNSKWVNSLDESEYCGRYYLHAGNVVIIHSPEQTLENANEACRETFLNLCTLLTVDVDQLELAPLDPKPKTSLTAVIPALKDSVGNLLGVEKGNGWVYEPETDAYFNYNSSVPGTCYTYAARYYGEESKNDECNALIVYKDPCGRIARCFIMIYEDGTQAQMMLTEPGYGDINIIAGNVCIIISNDCPETDVYDAEAFSVCLYHLCTMLGIDENALETAENAAPAK